MTEWRTMILKSILEVTMENEKAMQIAKILTQLALIMNQVREEKQIAAMAAYLSKHFTIEEIKRVSEYTLQKSKFFPAISDFFEMCKPVMTFEQKAILAYEKLHQDLRDFQIYQDFINSADETSIDFIGATSWSSAISISRRDAIEIFKIILKRGASDVKQIE